MDRPRAGRRGHGGQRRAAHHRVPAVPRRRHDGQPEHSDLERGVAGQHLRVRSDGFEPGHGLRVRGYRAEHRGRVGEVAVPVLQRGAGPELHDAPVPEPERAAHRRNVHRAAVERAGEPEQPAGAAVQGAEGRRRVRGLCGGNDHHEPELHGDLQRDRDRGEQHLPEPGFRVLPVRDPGAERGRVGRVLAGVPRADLREAEQPRDVRVQRLHGRRSDPGVERADERRLPEPADHKVQNLHETGHQRVPADLRGRAVGAGDHPVVADAGRDVPVPNHGVEHGPDVGPVAAKPHFNSRRAAAAARHPNLRRGGCRFCRDQAELGSGVLGFGGQQVRTVL
mmetsp:Transcript_25754/g.64922  ORF Transcript_25754/g.64922 Transcript_25754/m.64922 type:complete len:337 (-) Transcript_25754:3640-4650(-)